MKKHLAATALTAALGVSGLALVSAPAQASTPAVSTSHADHHTSKLRAVKKQGRADARAKLAAYRTAAGDPRLAQVPAQVAQAVTAYAGQAQGELADLSSRLKKARKLGQAKALRAQIAGYAPDKLTTLLSITQSATTATSAAQVRQLAQQAEGLGLGDTLLGPVVDVVNQLLDTVAHVLTSVVDTVPGVDNLVDQVITTVTNATDGLPVVGSLVDWLTELLRSLLGVGHP
jgi:hypothetical protein